MRSLECCSYLLAVSATEQGAIYACLVSRISHFSRLGLVLVSILPSFSLYLAVSLVKDALPFLNML